MANVLIDDTKLTALANAIRTKTGKSDTMTVAEMAEEVAEISGGGGTTEPEPLDVDFIDYDGTLLYSYTAEDFLNMTEMPPNPSHDGLIAQGWNWTLADAKETVAECGFNVIGQNYTTSDGKTRLYISIPSYMAPLNATVVINGTVNIIVEWGDGTISNYNNLSSNTRMTHVYQDAGDYIIAITADNDYSLGYWGANQGVFGGSTSEWDLAKSCLEKVEIGEYVFRILNNAFANCWNLKSISISQNVTEYGETSGNTYIFNNNYSLKGIVIPQGCTVIGVNTAFITSEPLLRYLSFPKSVASVLLSGFTSMSSLRKLILPSINDSQIGIFTNLFNLTHLYANGTYTTISGNGFSYIRSLLKFTIPATVTDIKSSYGLSFPYLMKELHCLPTTPPTLGHTRFISNLPSNCVIYVPYSEDHSILEAYQTATNWSPGASKMVEENP